MGEGAGYTSSGSEGASYEGSSESPTFYLTTPSFYESNPDLMPGSNYNSVYSNSLPDLLDQYIPIKGVSSSLSAYQMDSNSTVEYSSESSSSE